MFRSKFSVGDRVSWLGAKGTVVKSSPGRYNTDNVRVEFDKEPGNIFLFFQDGRYCSWHTKPSLKRLVKKKRASSTSASLSREKLKLEFGQVWEHEFYLDKDGSRTHCWFPTYKTWDEYKWDITSGKATHIASHRLYRAEARRRNLNKESK